MAIQSHVFWGQWKGDKPASELKTYQRKTELNAKWPFNVIQGHVFWSQWKSDKGLSNIKY